MSGKSRASKLNAMMRRPDCFFIGDLDRKIYHKKDCGRIAFITKSNLVACGRNPENQKFKPCPICKPEPIPKPEQHRKKLSPRAKSLVDLATRYGMDAEVQEPFITLKTLVGEWFFNFKAEEIILHHRNLEKWYNSDGTRKPGDFHRQDCIFHSPAAVIRYVSRHDNLALLRDAGESNRVAQLTAQMRDSSHPKLLCGEVEIQPGQTVVGLFPTGWCDATVLTRPEETGLRYWRFREPELNPYSPIGLFVRIPLDGADKELDTIEPADDSFVAGP